MQVWIASAYSRQSLAHFVGVATTKEGAEADRDRQIHSFYVDEDMTEDMIANSIVEDEWDKQEGQIQTVFGAEEK